MRGEETLFDLLYNNHHNNSLSPHTERLDSLFFFTKRRENISYRILHLLCLSVEKRKILLSLYVGRGVVVVFVECCLLVYRENILYSPFVEKTSCSPRRDMRSEISSPLHIDIGDSPARLWRSDIVSPLSVEKGKMFISLYIGRGCCRYCCSAAIVVERGPWRLRGEGWVLSSNFLSREEKGWDHLLSLRERRGDDTISSPFGRGEGSIRSPQPSEDEKVWNHLLTFRERRGDATISSPFEERGVDGRGIYHFPFLAKEVQRYSTTDFINSLFLVV
jgi:hypothetical protein